MKPAFLCSNDRHHRPITFGLSCDLPPGLMRHIELDPWPTSLRLSPAIHFD
ncbi:MAG: hypothetical protein KKG78_11720 [Alphaproteobacteria bacterium]|nr:hypothetical protein [Alphaproteobacteria bacterium]